MNSASVSEPVFVNVYGAQESIPPAYVAWRAGTKNRVVVPARQAGNRFLGSFKGFKIRTLYAIKSTGTFWQNIDKYSVHMYTWICLSPNF
jgi:hypothetical protein